MNIVVHKDALPKAIKSEIMESNDLSLLLFQFTNHKQKEPPGIGVASFLFI